ncbi:MAG: outer membrane lipoprotein-sorting protein [Candidatus Aminicenantes bacterium]|nr:outer membrane lipoprotein-sorting protein [Candidatus Aminicenantes bacterium]
MKKFLSFCLLSSLVFYLSVSAGFSQDAGKILKKMIDAQGGKKTLENIKDSTLSGTMEMIQAGITGSITLYQKEPNKMRMDGEVMGIVITQVYDGETAWMINPQTGTAEKLPEQATEEVKRQALGNDALLNPEKYGITYTYIGKENIDGKDYFVLEQTFSDGFKASLYIDSQTYLTYKTKAATVNQMGVEVLAETILSDYKEVEGMMVPHTLTIFQDGQEFMIMTITEAKFNTGLEDSLFTMQE